MSTENELPVGLEPTKPTDYKSVALPIAPREQYDRCYPTTDEGHIFTKSMISTQNSICTFPGFEELMVGLEPTTFALQERFPSQLGDISIKKDTG